jgi:hypothetical protein
VGEMTQSMTLLKQTYLTSHRVITSPRSVNPWIIVVRRLSLVKSCCYLTHLGLYRRQFHELEDLASAVKCAQHCCPYLTYGFKDLHRHADFVLVQNLVRWLTTPDRLLKLEVLERT